MQRHNGLMRIGNDLYISIGGAEKLCQDLEQGGFSGAVPPGNPECLPLSEHKGDSLKDDATVENLLERGSLEGDVHDLFRDKGNLPLQGLIMKGNIKEIYSGLHGLTIVAFPIPLDDLSSPLVA